MATILMGLRRRLPVILVVALLLGLATFVFSRSRPPVYSATATLTSTGPQVATDSTLGGALVRAPTLPEGAIAQIMQSTLIIQPLIQAIQKEATIPADERGRLIADLTNELRSQQLKTIRLTSRLEAYSGGTGFYTIKAYARSAATAATVANIASLTLLQWDRDRALENIRRAQAGYQAQLDEIDRQLSLSENSVERQTLISRRATLQSNLATAGVLAGSAVGVLNRLSDAVPPLRAEAPRPLTDAILATLLCLVAGGGISALMTVFDRTIRNEDDLLGLGLPTLATLPRLRQREVLFTGIVRAARQAGLYEALGFLRVNLLGAIRNVKHPVVMITSVAPGEGKSSVSATLADGFAASGQRVLVIDADLRRGTQDVVWRKYGETGNWISLTGNGSIRTTAQALITPEDVAVLEVEPNVHILPAGPSVQDSLSLFNTANLSGALDLWKQGYDIVLIDSAPILALADSLVLGQSVDGVILVTEYGRTPTNGLRSALRRAQRSNINILGAVINKADIRESSNYGYSYTYGTVKK